MLSAAKHLLPKKPVHNTRIITQRKELASTNALNAKAPSSKQDEKGLRRVPRAEVGTDSGISIILILLLILLNFISVIINKFNQQ